jgi:hypothetical protein
MRADRGRLLLRPLASASVRWRSMAHRWRAKSRLTLARFSAPEVSLLVVAMSEEHRLRAQRETLRAPGS